MAAVPSACACEAKHYALKQRQKTCSPPGDTHNASSDVNTVTTSEPSTTALSMLGSSVMGGFSNFYDKIRDSFSSRLNTMSTESPPVNKPTEE